MNTAQAEISTSRWVNMSIADGETEESSIAETAAEAIAYDRKVDHRVARMAPRIRPHELAASKTIEPIVSNARSKFRTIGELQDGGTRFLVNGWLPEGITYIAAYPGHGKSWLSLSLSQALTTGKSFLNTFEVTEQTPVIYMAPEVTSRQFKTNASKFKIPDDEKWFLTRTMSEGSVLALTDPDLLALVAKMKPVIMLDTVIEFNEAADENSSAQSRAFTKAVRGLLQAGAPAVICVHHAGKQFITGEMNLANCLRGTSALAANGDTIWCIRRDEVLYDDGRGPEEVDMKNVKARPFDVAPRPMRLALRYRKADSTIGSCFDDMGDFQIVDPGVVQIELGERLDSKLIETPTSTVRELMVHLGLKKNRVEKLLIARGWKSTEGGRWLRTSDTAPGAGKKIDEVLSDLLKNGMIPVSEAQAALRAEKYEEAAINGLIARAKKGKKFQITKPEDAAAPVLIGMAGDTETIPELEKS
jgi:hypothetical protein